MHMDVYFRRVVELEEDVRELLDMLRWRRVISAGDVVLLKPNFCGELRKGVTTNLELLECVVSLLRDRAERVLVGESESPYKNLEGIFGKLKLEAELVNLSRVPGRRFGRGARAFELPELVFESKIVNLPVLKTHVLTVVTLGIKNLFGFVAERDKARYHHCIDDVLMEVLELVRPQVCINLLDATFAMDGSGPMDGRVLKPGFLMASRDVVALDVAACRVAGVEPVRVPHIRRAVERYGGRVEIHGSEPPAMKLRMPEGAGVHRWIAEMQRFSLVRWVMDREPVKSAGRRVMEWMSRGDEG